MDEKLTYQKQVGLKGEQIAADFMRSEGYQVLDQNYHTRYGEVDLVAEGDQCIIFVEVKARTTGSFGLPEESVTPEKLEKIYDTALLWLQDHPDKPDVWRVDVIAILMDKDLQAQDVQHFINVD